jgi:nitroreductase
MNFLSLLSQRLSIRHYSDKPVPRSVLERCLEAARLAPSACNSQPWYFIVIDDANLKNQVCDAAFSGIYFSNHFAKTAPVVIVLVTERSKYIARLGGHIRNLQYSLVDIGIVGEHFILQAAEEGLGTCWLGWLNEKAIKKVLQLPKEVNVDVMISVGYPESTREKKRLRKSLDEIRGYNHYQPPA